MSLADRKSRILSALDPSEIIHINPAATSKMIDDIAKGTAYNLDRNDFSSLPSRQRSASVSQSVPKHIREENNRASRQVLPSEWMNSCYTGKMDPQSEAPFIKSKVPTTSRARPSRTTEGEGKARPSSVMGEDTLRGMNADPTIKPAMRRKLNYNSIRMLPRINSSSPHSSVREEESRITSEELRKSEVIIQDYKNREEALDKRIRKVLSDINSERFELTKMVASFKQKIEEEEMVNKKLRAKNHDLKVLIKSLRTEKSKEHSLVEAAELKNKQMTEQEAEANRKINQLERDLEEERDRNSNLSHRILFLEAKLEKEQQNQQNMQQQIMDKFTHIEEELKNRSPPAQLRFKSPEPEQPVGSPPESIQVRESPFKSQEPQGRLQRSFSVSHSPFAKGKKDKKEITSPKKEHVTSKGGIFGSVKNLLRQSSSKSSPTKTRDRSESAPVPVVPEEAETTPEPVANNPQPKMIIASPKRTSHHESPFKSPGVAPRVPDRSNETNTESNTIRTKGNEILGSKKRNSNSTILALYDYASRAEDDLEFQEGELLTLHKRYSDGWWLAELKGKLGRVPSNYFQDLSKVEPMLMMAVGDFHGQCESDLTFKRGQIIKVYNMEDDWWVGETEGIVGYLPSNFVINQRV